MKRIYNHCCIVYDYDIQLVYYYVYRRGSVMSTQINIRLDDVHLAILEAMIEKMQKDGIKSNRTDCIQKALYSFARDYVLDGVTVGTIIDKHYKGAWERQE